MKIAYITDGDPFNKHSWSGTNYYTRKALEDQGNDVYCIHSMPIKFSWRILCKILCAKIKGKQYSKKRNKLTALMWAKYITKRLQPDTDAIFSLGTIPISMLKTEIPIYIYVDGIFEHMRRFYKWDRFCKQCVDESNEIEQLAINNCKQIISCSLVTGEAIKEYYKIDDNKLKIVPLGANLDRIPDIDYIKECIEKRQPNCCEILFVGVDWERKGADIVLETVNILHERGVEVKLNLCGLREIKVKLPYFVENYGFLSKEIEEEAEILKKLYATSHFLFVPSRAEAYGLVFCEASAYGLPSVSFRSGGLTTIVVDGVNGQLMDINAKPSDFADYIQQQMIDYATYKLMCYTSRKRYDEYLNWNVVGKQLMEIMLDKKVISKSFY